MSAARGGGTWGGFEVAADVARIDPATTADADLAPRGHNGLPERVGARIDPVTTAYVKEQAEDAIATVRRFAAERFPLRSSMTPADEGWIWRGSQTDVPTVDGRGPKYAIIVHVGGDLRAAQAHAERLGLTPGTPGAIDWRTVRVARADTPEMGHQIYCGAPIGEGGWCNLRVGHQGEDDHEQRPPVDDDTVEDGLPVTPNKKREL